MSDTLRPATAPIEILIAEDSPTQAQQLRHILAGQGYLVTHAVNGRQALEAARQRKPALIICDIVMPEMDGYELCIGVRADPSLADIPVIMVTSMSEPHDLLRSLACGADSFIHKPYDEHFLRTRVQFALDNPRERRAEGAPTAMEVVFNGERHLITASPVQILNLLLSSYGAANRQVEELKLLSEQLNERTQLIDQQNAALLEARAEADRANRAKSEFLSRMSHELRTPLNAILGFAQLLGMDHLDDDQRESADQILKGGRHLLDLINEVLDISRIETDQLPMSPAPVNLREAIEDAVALIGPLATARGIAIHVEAIAPGQHVLADRQRLKQVLLNLLSNAVKYNRADGGSVTVACRLIAGERLRISMTDTGYGIPAAQLDRLFAPFDRLGAEASATEGTGLGLALSKALVEHMGGTIGVDSTPGEGSTFWLELPVATPAASERSDEPPLPAATTAGTTATGTVLYIEDNLSNFRLVERVLDRRGEVRLIPAMLGRLGLDLAREHRPDLVLLDLHLPDMNGEELLARLRADPATRDIPVIVLSADATPDQIERLLANGARAYLTKPLDIGEFLALVDDVLVPGKPADPGTP